MGRRGLVVAVYDRPVRIVGVEVISIVCIVQMSTVHPRQPTSRCGNYSRAYESSLTCEIAFADKAPVSARKGMGIQASESSDSVVSLGSGRDSK
jgi:hypothetical protein